MARKHLDKAEKKIEKLCDKAIIWDKNTLYGAAPDEFILQSAIFHESSSECVDGTLMMRHCNHRTGRANYRSLSWIHAHLRADHRTVRDGVQSAARDGRDERQAPSRNITVPGKKRETTDTYVQQFDATASRQSTLVNEYLMETSGDPPKLALHTRDECPLCHDDLILVNANAVMTCKSCGYSVAYLDATMQSMSYSDDVEFSSFSNKRINHFNEWLQQVQAKENFEIGQDILQSVVEELHFTFFAPFPRKKGFCEKMKSKSKCIPPGTTVVLSGLERNPKLNHNRGETIGSFDGGRYAVKLGDGSIVRVTPDKLAPAGPVEFVEYVQRLTDELCVFAHHHFDQPSSLFPMDATSLGAKCMALTSKTSRIALSSTKLLRLYEGACDSPYMQLKPLQTVPVGQTIRLGVLLYDSPTVVPPDLDCDAQYIMLSCRGSTLFFENNMPNFHMSMSHMHSYTTERMAACLADNYFEIVRYMRCVDEVEDATYHPSSRTLLFKLKSSEARGKIVCPTWNCDVFAVARHGHMTEHRISFLCKAASSQRPSHAVYMFPIGSIVNHEKKKLTVGEHGFEDTRNFLPSVDTFLQSQLVLAAHFLKYGLVSMQTMSTQLRRHMEGIIAVICDMVRQNAQEKMAQVAQKIMTLNVSDGTHFLLCPDFMDSVYKNEDRLVAWIANLEALLNAFTIVLDGPNSVLSLDDGLLKVSCEKSIELYVASFANDPIENQAWIFQRELSLITEATQTASLQQTIQRLATASTDMAGNVGSAVSRVVNQLVGEAQSAEPSHLPSAATEKPVLARKRTPKSEKVEVVHDDVKFQECLRRQQALIDEEEAERCKATSADGKKKKRKKKKTKTTTTAALCDDDPSQLVEEPDSFVERDGKKKEEEPDSRSPSFARFLEPPVVTSPESPIESPTVESSVVAKIEASTDFNLMDAYPIHADQKRDASQSPASQSPVSSSSSSSSADALSDALTERNVSTEEVPFQPVSTRANVRVDKMKKTLATAHDRIEELERECAAFKLEVDRHRLDKGIDARRIASLNRDLNGAVERIESIEKSHAQHAVTITTLVETHAVEIGKLENELVDYTEMHKQTMAHSVSRKVHESMTLKYNALSLNVEKHSCMLLLKLAGQIRHYLKGHYMKLDQDTLSIPAVLRDGYAAIMLIDLYTNLKGDKHTPSAEQVVDLAISTTLDMKVTDSAGVTWASP